MASKSLRSVVEEEIKSNIVLNNDIYVELLNRDNAKQMISLYNHAYGRGDWFGSSYSDPKSTIFNEHWLSSISYRENHVWIIFKEGDEVVGATALIDKEEVVSIDETQLDPLKGRGKGIMSTYFRRFIPLLQKNGFRLSTEFVLTPESKSLRKVLIGELGMIPTGLLPGVLYSPIKKIFRSEITAVWAPDGLDRSYDIIPEVKPLYDIVVEAAGIPTKRQENNVFPMQKNSSYVGAKISIDDSQRQKEYYDSGFRPVELNIIKGEITFSKFSSDAVRKLDFIYSETENAPQLKVNLELLEYVRSLIGGL